MAYSPQKINPNVRKDNSPSSSGSDSSSTSEEERLRRLFESCDGDGDGFIDGNDFIYMCQQLSMEEYASEIMMQLGMNQTSRMSFNDFIRYRSQVTADLQQSQYLEDAGIVVDTSGGMLKQQNNMTSWPTMSSDSLGAHSGRSGRPDSLDYDSGARDLYSPEPSTSLQKQMESHDPKSLRLLQESFAEAPEFLDLANRLHQAALTSLKGELIELSNRLQHVLAERDALEKQINKSHQEKLHLQEDYEERLENATFRYEERITELHSVIAELRKKIERHQISIIREEDEELELDPAISTKSQDGGSINDNNATASVENTMEGANDLNSELSRVVTELESAIDERKRIAAQVDAGSEDIAATEDDNVEEKALEICKNMEDFDFSSPPTLPPKGLRPATFHPPPPPPPNEFPDPAYLQEEISSLRTENSTLQETLSRQEAELNKIRTALGSIREERDKFKRKVQDLQTRTQGYEGSSSPHGSRTSTPTKAQQHGATAAAERPVGSPSCDLFPVAKVAELKKLKTVSSDRQVLGPEISSIGVPNTKVAEHLVQSMWKGSNMQEIVQSVDQSGGSLRDSKVPEFEIELERLQSKIDNLKSQNDLTNLTLEESKAQADRLTVLIGKYESNNTALCLALNYSDQCLEAYEILCALLESEQGVMLANCRAAGLGAGDRYSDDKGEIAAILQRAHQSRRTAENVAKHLLHKLDRSCGIVVPPDGAQKPWEDLSSTTSRTASTTSSTGSSGDGEFSKVDERRLRDHISQLKSDRTAVKMTVTELESVHIDPVCDQGSYKNTEASRLDLENAVIMQELMAIKEEKAELKAQYYLLEKEKRALELSLSGKESREQAYLVQIEHLKSEVSEQQHVTQEETQQEEEADTTTPAITLAEFRSHDPSQVAQDLSDSLKREKKLKSRIQELVSALEKLSRNSEVRHQQSAEFVNDLKRANSALISAFDKAKKKYQSKLKKLESQMQSLTERYETQIRLLKQRISQLEDERSRPLPTNETSL